MCQMIPDVGTSNGHRFAGSFKLTTMYLKYVPEVVENFERSFNLVPLCGAGQSFCVIEQYFLAANLNE